jgi:hypothetical protein
VRVWIFHGGYENSMAIAVSCSIIVFSSVILGAVSSRPPTRLLPFPHPPAPPHRFPAFPPAFRARTCQPLPTLHATSWSSSLLQALLLKVCFG